VAFEAIKGSGNESDIAIDSIMMNECGEYWNRTWYIVTFVIKWHTLQTVNDLISSLGKTNQRMRQTRASGYTGSRIKCLGGVSIPCWPFML
jgi:hypothetical protein